MIQSVSTRDARYPIGHGHGSDAIHKEPVYSYAVTELHDDKGRTGIGLAFTLGEGNQLVCDAANFYARRLIGQSINEIMAGFGGLQREMADEQQFRWLGPHKGIVQLALASVTNACWDLWAKTRAVPLWKLLLNLSPEQIEAIGKALPEFSPSKIAAGTYRFLEKDHITIGVYNFAIGRADLPDDLVYQLVKAVFENQPRLVKATLAASDTLPQNVVKDTFLPFHPGAIRYYREIGIKIPQTLVPTN